MDFLTSSERQRELSFSNGGVKRWPMAMEVERMILREQRACQASMFLLRDRIWTARDKTENKGNDADKWSMACTSFQIIYAIGCGQQVVRLNLYQSNKRSITNNQPFFGGNILPFSYFILFCMYMYPLLPSNTQKRKTTPTPPSKR